MSTKNPLICVLSVDFGVNESANVEILYQSDPQQLADAFICINSLDPNDADLRLALTTHITSNYLEARARYDQQIAERAARKSQEIPHGPRPPPPPALDSRQSSPSKSENASPVGNRSAFSGVSRASDVGQRAMIGSEDEIASRYDSIVQSVSSIANAAAHVTSTSNSRKHSLINRSSISSISSKLVGDQASRKSTESSLQKTNTASVRPPSIPARKVSVSSSLSNSALYDRLHKEAEEKAKRSAELATHVRKLERDNYIEQRRMFGYKPQIASELSNKPRVEDRLYEFAKEDAIRKQESLSVQRAELAAKTEGAWICPSCGITNAASLLLCENPLKFGSVVLASNKRVCGGGRPNSTHIPSISMYAHQKSRSSNVPHLPAAATIGVEQYKKDMLSREEQGQARIDAELRSQTFKPAVSQRSSELADVARIRRLKALAQAQTALPSAHLVSSLSQDAAVERLAGLSSHELLYEDAILRQRASESVADEIIARSGVARSEAELEEFFTRMHAYAAETRARIDASRERLAEQELKEIQSSRFRENKRTAFVTSSLFDHVAQQQRNKDAAISAAHQEAERMFRSRHTLKHSESLLEKRREQCFAGVYNALVKSMQLSPAARADESAAQFAFERTIGGARGSAGPRSFEAGAMQPHETVSMTREDLAASLVALRVYSVDESDGQIEEAHSVALDLDAVWSTCLVQPQLVKLVDIALSRLRIQTSIKYQQQQRQFDLDRLRQKISQETDESMVHFPLSEFIAFGGSNSNPDMDSSSPRLARFQEFCSSLGRILEEVGGGPQVYVLARRLGKKQDDNQAPSQPLDKAHLIKGPHDSISDPSEAVGERLHAKESEYSRVRIYREIDKLRSQFDSPKQGKSSLMLESRDDSAEAVRLLRKFTEKQRAVSLQMQQNNLISNPSPWLPPSVASEAARNTELIARQMGLVGMNYYASAASSRQGSPAMAPVTSGSSYQPTQRSPQKETELKGDVHQSRSSFIGSPKSPPTITRTFITSSGDEGNVSRLSSNSGYGGAFVMSPQNYQRVEDYGYTPAAAEAGVSSVDYSSLIHESGELDKSLAKLSSISIQALNDRIERILRSPPHHSKN